MIREFFLFRGFLAIFRFRDAIIKKSPVIPKPKAEIVREVNVSDIDFSSKKPIIAAGIVAIIR